MPNLDLRPGTLTFITYYKGDQSVRFNFTQNSVAYPLTDVTAASFVVYEKNGTAALTLTHSSGLTISAAGGYIDMAITNAQIVALFSQEYNYEFSLTLTGGTVWPILDSVFIVSEDGQTAVTDSDINISLDGTNVDVSVIAPASSGGGGTWGSITGTLSDQTDLQAALDAKAASSHTHALSDITQSGATTNQVPKWNGSAWVPANEAGGADGNGIYSGSGTIPGATEALLEPNGSFDIHFDGGIGAFVISDGTGSTAIQNKAGTATIAADSTGVIIVADDMLSIEAEGSTGTLNQVLTRGANGAIWQDAAGGGASVTEITYADMQTAIAGGTLTPGAWYLITDATGTDLGFLTNAINENTINVSGVGGYLNADFQAVGDYSGATIPAAPYYIYYTGASGTFTVGETITGDDNGSAAVIVSDDEGGTLEVSDVTGDWNTETTFSGDTSLNTATFSGYSAGSPEYTPIQQGIWQAANEGGYTQGDATIWNLLHYQLTDSGAIDGTDPATNTAAYTALAKGDYPGTYVTAWDVSEYDVTNNAVLYRQDLRGGLVRGTTGVSGYQFGRDACAGNNIQSPSTFDIRNLIAGFNNNTTLPGATVSDIITGLDTVIENNILENGASLTGITAGANCSISRNKVGPVATLGGGTTMGDGAQMNDNVLGPSASISDSALSDGAAIETNNLLGGAQIGNNTLNESALISGNNIGSDASIMGNTLMDSGYISGNILLGADAAISNNTVQADGQIANCTVTPGVDLANKTVQTGIYLSESYFSLSANETEDISDNIEGNRTQSGFSDIPGTIDITGLTTLDCTAAWAQYRGIFNLTSTNATEAIDTITNPPTAFPFTIRPAAGLVLTITGTAYAGIAAGQIALKATDYTLDGDKGEYIVLEIDPLGTGALIEKQVVNGLL